MSLAEHIAAGLKAGGHYVGAEMVEQLLNTYGGDAEPLLWIVVEPDDAPTADCVAAFLNLALAQAAAMSGGASLRADIEFACEVVDDFLSDGGELGQAIRITVYDDHSVDLENE